MCLCLADAHPVFFGFVFSLDEAQSAPVPVMVTSFRPSYRYAPKELLITYGTGVLVTLLATLIGIHAILLNGRKSYSTKFSTFVRVMRRHELDVVVDEQDQGWNPLPKKVGDAKLSLHGGGRGSHVVLLQENMKGSDRGLMTE